MNSSLETYQHFKGGVYVKLCEAKHSENKEELVIYACASSGEIFARPKNMFYENVEKENYTGPRFIKIPPIVSKDKRKKLRVIDNGK